MRKAAIICIAGMFLIPSLGSAQEKKKQSFGDFIKSDWSVTPSIGLMHFYGDLRQYDFYPAFRDVNENRMGFGLTINKAVSNTVVLNTGLQYGSLQGVRRGRAVGPGYPNGRYFNTNILHGFGRVTLNLNDIISPYRESLERKWAIYAFTGLGLTNFDSQVYMLDTDEPMVPMRGKGKSGKTTETTGHIGMMAKYYLGYNMDIGLEASYNMVNTDRLDAWEEPLTAKDRYSYIALNFTYHFGASESDEPRERVSPMDELLKRMDDLENKEPGSSTGDAAPAEHTHDTDGDGVADDKDEERFSPGGAKVDDRGVAEDDDNDGVPNVIDEEPNTPAGSMVNFKGVKIEPGEKVIERVIEGPGGAAVPTSSREGLKVLDNIYFDTNSDVVRANEKSKIDKLADQMKSNASMEVMLVGVADFRGDAAYNLALSKRRAEATKQYLVSKGIAAKRIEVAGQGEIQSEMADIDKNRKVEIYLKK